MWETIGSVLLVLIMVGSLVSSFGDVFGHGRRVHVNHAGVADALTLARDSHAVRALLGDGWEPEKCWVSLDQEEILEHTIYGTVHIAGPKNRAKLEFEYKCIGSSSKHLRVKVKVAKETVELTEG